MSDLNGKIVLITGAAGAVGSAVTAAVKQAGGTAIATDLAAGAGIDLRSTSPPRPTWQRAAAEIERRTAGSTGW